MLDLLTVFLGGGLGATMRYGLAGAVYKSFGSDFPYGTLLVNVLGCFLIGLFMAMSDGRFVFHPRLRLLVTIGILGGFTTFSTFSYETVALLREGSWLAGGANIVLSLCTCLGATWLGGLAGRIV